MKQLKLFWFCGCLICITPFLNAADSNAAERKAALDGILKQLNRKPTEAELWMGNRAAWYDTNAHNALHDFIIQNTNTDEAITAKLWLTIAKTSADENSVNLSRRHAAEFQTIITNFPDSWQAKAARLGRCSALLVGRQGDELYKEVNNVLSTMDDYRIETNQDFLVVLKIMEIEPAEIEPALKNLLLINYSNEGKLEEALQYAVELQSKFPEWSRKNRINGEIKRLKKGGTYDSLPSR